MSTLEPVKSMYDVALRPRVLRTITREDLPDEKKPLELDAPSKLSRIVSAVQTHRLLSESHSSADAKLTERWKSAVDDWVDRLLSLVSSSLMPDKCWAGICLLGVTFQECSSERFLASYSVWFEKLLLHIQSPADSQFVKVASCAAMSDLITRLALFPSEKKDAVSHTGKLIQPLLKLLKEDSSESIWEGAIHLLCTIITSFPASVHRHYDNVEAAVASKILSGSFSINLKGKLAHCLALLPRSKGDETSWLSTMRKMLLLVNGYLTEIFHGLEEDTRWSDAVKLLVPPGEDVPSTIWGQNLLDETSDKTRKRSKLSSVSAMMLSCSLMLTHSYPVQVAVPVRSLLTIIERVLMVDGTVPRAALPFVIASEQEFTCTELPILHLDGLELLISVIKGLHSQLLPHVASVVRVMKEYLNKCESPKLRAKVYSITKMLLVSMGVGTAIYVAKEVVDHALTDLSSAPDDAMKDEAQPGLPGLGKRKLGSSDTLGKPGAHSHRKRKLGATGSLEQLQESSVPVSDPNIHEKMPLLVRIAALETLEALLTVGGALKSESWRSKVDHFLIKLASNSCKGGWTNEENGASLLNGSPSTHLEFQLAALRALFASVLSPSSVRPPHLAGALELFRTVKREAGTKTSEFCTFALFSLEVLIHPRGLPMETFPSGMQHMDRGLSDSDDDMYGFESSKDTMVPQEVPRNVTDKLGPETLRIDQDDEITMLESLGTESLRETDRRPASDTVGSDMRANDNVMVESMDLRESRLQLDEPVPSTVDSRRFQEAPPNQEAASSKETSSIKVATNPVGQNVESNNADAFVYSHHNTTTDDKATASKHEGFISQKAAENVDPGHESDDSFPDIVDAEPDSD